MAASGRVLGTCVGSGGATMQLLWTAGGALSVGEFDALARAGGFASGGREGGERALDGDVRGASLSREQPGGPLRSDVYFLSAGQRYGLLTIVYGREATFHEDERVAGWLETIEGAAPWGAPVRPTLRARCPDGFQASESGSSDAALLCLAGVGTEAFTVVRLSQSEGGFGADQDRVRLAGDLAARIARNPQRPARMLEPPGPFTRARNVDAIRARFESDERIVLGRSVLWARTPRSGNVVALYMGPDDPRAHASVFVTLRGVWASRVPFRAATGGAAMVTLAGLILGVLLSRPRSPTPSSPVA
jgi:hypothetical protein